MNVPKELKYCTYHSCDMCDKGSQPINKEYTPKMRKHKCERQLCSYELSICNECMKVGHQDNYQLYQLMIMNGFCSKKCIDLARGKTGWG